MNQNDQNYLYGQAETEEDQPLDHTEEQYRDSQDRLEELKLEVAEKDKDRKEKRYFTAFNLIEVCLGILVFIYISESFLEFKAGMKTGEIANSVTEIIKTLLFTLSGYLFAKKENGD